MSEELYRITMLEEAVKAIRADHNSLLEKQDRRHGEMMDALAELKEARVKDVGFIGGIVFTVSSLWAVFTYILPDLK